MIQFDEKIEAVLIHYDRRMDDEAALVVQLPEAEMMQRIDEFLLPVGKETGSFINMLAKSAKAKTILELGTSYGYSTVWLAEAARINDGKVITMEISKEKSEYAKERTEEAGLSEWVEFRIGDAVQLIKEATEKFDFVLVDLWKELYLPCLNEFYWKLNRGAWVLADNIIYPPQNHDEVESYRNRIKETKVFDTILLPIGSGIELSQFKG